LRIVGGSFDTAVSRAVVTLAVTIVFAVGFIVFFIVGNQIMKRKAVMSGDEVDACIGPPAGGLL
jgi:hypothetical protein